MTPTPAGTPPEPPGPRQPEATPPHPAPARRPSARTIADVFGDVLPDVTDDERTPDPHGPGHADADAWYRDNRPPHHDRD